MFIDEIAVHEREGGSGLLCREILGELPEWFGIPAAIEEYAARAESAPVLVATKGQDEVGLLVVADHGPHSAEIELMAVRPDFHRRGVGRLLVQRVEERTIGRGGEFLQVKTLSERRADLRYAGTRAFYRACGFRDLGELPGLWDEENPALQLVKHLGTRSGLHHVELWVPDLARAAASFGWLLTSLGYGPYQQWSSGRSWRRAGHYVVVEQSPALLGASHERLRPGLNHLAFHAGTEGELDSLVASAGGHGWQLLFADRHPHAGGPSHYAAYLENEDGFEVELVAGG